MHDLDIKRLDHHGIVAGTFDALGLGDKIDEFIRVDDQEHLSAGQGVKALIVAGLGFTNTPLMLTPKFFENLPTEMLLGEGIAAEHCNRHKLGRVLDALYEQGCSDLFYLLAAHVCQQAQVDRGVLSLDSTTFGLTGQYDEATDTEAISVCHGYSKDHRPDLKQVVTELVVSQDGGIPLMMQCHDGNASDSTIFQERSEQLVKQLKDSETLKAWVADSKLYSASNAKALAQLPFITRIPRTLKEENDVVTQALARPDAWQPLIAAHGEHDSPLAHRYQSFAVTHYGMAQRFIVVYSEPAKSRSEATVQKAVQREKSKLDKALFHFQAQRFACRNDGEKAFAVLSKGLRYHTLAKPTWVEHPHYAAKGRPQRGKAPTATTYQGQSQAIQDEDNIKANIDIKACYVIGTTVEEAVMSAQQIVQTYKGQSAVEGGFRFLKDPLFFTSSFFIKKPERIEALLMVMTLALLVYSIAQRRLRETMSNQGETLPNQIGKDDPRPTLRWIFQCFEGVHVVRLQGTTQIHGLTQLRQKIINLLAWPHVSNIYLNYRGGG